MEQSILSRFSKATSELTSAYQNGEVGYPRVAFNYITEIKFYEFPHPPLNRFNSFSSPLLHKSYPFNKKMLPLELTNANIATPATLMNNITAVDLYFDNDLNPKPLKAKELQSKLDALSDHLDNLALEYGDSIFDQNYTVDVNHLCKDGVVSQFIMEITPFRIKLEPSPQREKRVNDEEKKRVNDDIKNFPPVVEEKIIYVSSLDEAHELYKKKLLLLRKFKENRENALKQQEALAQIQ